MKQRGTTIQTEAEFQQAVVEYAQLHSWIIAHFRPARTTKGWAVPVQYDGAGFPDLVLVKDRVLFAELKSVHGRVSADQRWWLSMLAGAGAETFLWRPSDWPVIETVLSS